MSPGHAGPAASSLVAALLQARGHDARSPIRQRIRDAGPAVVGPLLALLDHEDDMTRWEAVNLLGALAPASAAAEMTAHALQEREIHARWRAFWAVCRLPRPLVRPALHAALAGLDPEAAWNAAMMLSMMDDAAAADHVLAGLTSPDAWRRWEAVGAARALRLREAVPALLPLLAPQVDRATRQEVVLALGAIGGDDARATLRAVLDDPEAQLRWRAAMALARRATPLDREALRTRLAREDDPGVRVELARALPLPSR